jgi:DNA mismatch repair protein MutS
MSKGPVVETPLMKQYNTFKTKYPGAILLFRVGDFYETFGEDAIKVSQILGIVLTRRGNGSGTDIELAGFPYHSLDTYLPKLVRAGQRVAICEQLEDPKMAKGIVKRGVTELVTPGVALSDKILEMRESNFLAAFHFYSPTEAAVAFVEVSTGEFFCFSGPVYETEKLVHSLRPAEVLVPRKDVRAFQEQVGEKYYLTRQEDWVFQFDYARDTLLGHFQTHSLKGFGVEEDAQGIIAAGALLHYLKDSQQNRLGHISTIYRFENSGYVWLDAFTVRNLEILQPNHPDGKSLVDVMDKTLTPMGARMLRRWMLFPLKDVKEIGKRHGKVEAFIKDSDALMQLEETFRKLGDLERLASRLATLKLVPREAMLLRNSLQSIPAIKDALLAFQSADWNEAVAEMADVAEAAAILDSYLEAEPSNVIGSGDVIRNGVSAELDELRAIMANGKELLATMQAREIERTGISSLKIGYNKVFGYFLEVTHLHKNKVPDDFIRKQTLTNAERYITDELKQYEDKILGAEEKVSAIESDLYQELLMKLQIHLDAIQRNAAHIASADVLISFARVAKANFYKRPEVNTGTTLDIKAGRHPVIETVLKRDTPFIPNDVFLDNETQQIIIITGPNMAGKSALLRQTGLIVLLAQIGSFVPADHAVIGVVDKIFTRVGASDNLSGGESTFMVEMNETARIINTATPRSLILLDEIGRGTSTYDGVSIAWALVEHLHENTGCAAKTLFATHYHELNEISNQMHRVKNYNVSVKEAEGKILFMRKLVPGGSAHSFGIHVAEMAGMPQGLLTRAKELLVHFESHKVSETEKVRSIPFSSRQNVQLNMFELKDEDTLRLREVLAGVEIDRMTPVEALLKLQEIKKALEI